MAAKITHVFINTKNKEEAADAVSRIQTAAEQEGIQYAFSLAIRPGHWDAAHAIGLARTTIKKALKGGPRHTKTAALTMSA